MRGRARAHRRRARLPLPRRLRQRRAGALRNLGGLPADIHLLDIHLAGMPVSDAVRLFHDRFPATRIVMVTVFEDDARIFTSLQRRDRLRPREPQTLPGPPRRPLPAVPRNRETRRRPLPQNAPHRARDRVVDPGRSAPTRAARGRSQLPTRRRSVGDLDQPRARSREGDLLEIARGFEIGCGDEGAPGGRLLKGRARVSLLRSERAGRRGWGVEVSAAEMCCSH